MNHYILIKSGGHDAAGHRLSAQQSAIASLNASMWPLWDRTRNRKAIQVGDHLAIYLSGAGNCQIIATAKVSDIRKWDVAAAKRYPLTVEGIPFCVLYLNQIRHLPKPVNVKERLAMLSFISQGSRTWGVAFMGGTRAVSLADFNVLTSRSGKPPENTSK